MKGMKLLAAMLLLALAPCMAVAQEYSLTLKHPGEMSVMDYTWTHEASTLAVMLAFRRKLPG